MLKITAVPITIAYICLKHYKLNLKSGFVFLYLIIIFITLLIPVIIYLMYGREEFHETGIIYQGNCQHMTIQ